MYGEEWLMKKENLNFINCIYLFIIFCLLITLSIFSQRIHKSIEVVWLKRTIHFYIQWHKEIFIDYEDTREPLLGSMSTSWWCQCHFSLGSFETITNKKLCIFLQKKMLLKLLYNKYYSYRVTLYFFNYVFKIFSPVPYNPFQMPFITLGWNIKRHNWNLFFSRKFK